MLDASLDKFINQLPNLKRPRPTIVGRIEQITGLIARARLPKAKLGELCFVICPGANRKIWALVVGFDGDDVFLTSFESLSGVAVRSKVIATGEILAISVSDSLLGRVIDPLGTPLDGGEKLPVGAFYPVRASAPKALNRRQITRSLPVGVKTIDTLLRIGEGQRMGIFSSAGMGKSSLLGMIARNSQAEINVVALIGERGREVGDFLRESLGPEGLRRSVVVVSTSDETPARRMMAAYTATAIAEYFRDQGKKVMLLMDSLTRFARALREIALSLGEPPARLGYPPSVFVQLPELLERAGSNDKGSITAFYSVLLTSQLTEDPLGEEVRAILDGHIVLKGELVKRQHFPAIDILASNSRLMTSISEPEQVAVSGRIKELWSSYEQNRDLINLGAYKVGADPRIDMAIKARDRISQFLRQKIDESHNDKEAWEMLKRIDTNFRLPEL